MLPEQNNDMRTEGDFIKINEWLLPLSWIYGFGVRLRNMLFDARVLKSRSFPLPVISVGNITVGGTGKTPHVEYLIRLLSNDMKVAVLSRGYKRKSHGYILAGNKTPMQQLGDEPYQMKHKFADIHVAVDKDRCHGITRLMSDQATRNVEVVLLDDAYQHRYVKPGLNILLVDYHRLTVYDRLLPAGRLREHHDATSRADVVVITKCPKDLKPMEYRVLEKAMNLFPFQQLYFSTLDYGNLQPVFGGKPRTLESIGKDTHILLLTGIASPQQMIADLQPYSKNITQLEYADHHFFTPDDVEAINQAFEALPNPKVIITTEKDSVRLHDVKGLSGNVKRNLFALPINVRFLQEAQTKFNNTIIEYVRANKRNSSVAQSPHDH